MKTPFFPDLIDEFRSPLYGDLLEDEAGFLSLAAHLKALAGIPLPQNEKNTALMAGRLAKIIAKYGCSGYRDFESLLVSGNVNVRRDFLSAMTTHTTQFFREPAHFQFLESSLPTLLKRRLSEGKRELVVWSAASSTGEEVWTLAITLREIMEKEKLNFEIRCLATDIDRSAIVRASRAIYSQDSVKEIPPHLLHKYFAVGRGQSSNHFRIKKSLRSLVTFAEFNLQQRDYPFQQGFDIIFCRNVFIYFDAESVKSIVLNMEKVIRPGGYLFVGHSEAIVSLRSNNLRKVAPAVFLRDSVENKERPT